MNVIGIIPARMAASRFPGKPLAKLLGKTMIEHCYYRSKLAKKLSKVYVATCDSEINELIIEIGGLPIMTSVDHKRASTRTAEALEKIERNSSQIDIVVMIQGDEPLVNPKNLDEIINHFQNPDVKIVNLMSKFNSENDFIDKNNVKVVVDKNFNALYFSREPIPSPWKGWKNFPRYMQTGIIAFRKNALYNFNSLNESDLEIIESVDMNRVIENGEKIRMVLSNSFNIGVDTQEELFVAEKYLRKDVVTKKYCDF